MGCEMGAGFGARQETAVIVCRAVGLRLGFWVFRVDGGVSISISGGVKAGGNVREEQRPTSISPESFQAHQRLITCGCPELA